MSIKGLKVGIVLTGSFCTFAKAKSAIRELVEAGADVLPVFSYHAQSIDSRFCKAKEYVKEIEALTGNSAILTIEDAEPIGPLQLTDVLAIAPCTGNTLAKLNLGITDTPALMAAKAHMRTGKPLVISISTNDALGLCFKNIGSLMSSKDIYFVPFGQDNPEKKPKSMVAHMELLIPTIEAALLGKQIQPILKDDPNIFPAKE